MKTAFALLSFFWGTLVAASTVQINSQLSATLVNLSSVGTIPAQGSYNLAPGSYSVSYESSLPTGNVNNSIPFTIASDGTVSYDASYAGQLSGQGTQTLTITGIPFTLNSQLSPTQLTLGGQGTQLTSGVNQLCLLPGAHAVYYYSDLQSGSVVPLYFVFTLNADGTVAYDPSFATVLSGQGTQTLTATGLNFHFVSQLSLNTSNFFIAGLPLQFSSGANSFNLLPGTYYIAYEADLPSGTTNVGFQFTLGSDGTISYDSSLSSELSGEGTNTLTVTGVNMQVSPPSSVNPGDVFISGLSTQFSSGVNSIHLLPGSYFFAAFSTQAATPTVSGFQFALNSDQTVTVPSSLSANATGGTSLVVQSVPTQSGTNPVITLPAMTPQILGTTFSGTGSFVDPDVVSWSATVNYGDGSNQQPLPITGRQFNFSHVYANPGRYQLSVNITGSYSETASATTTVNVYTTQQASIATLVDDVQDLVQSGHMTVAQAAPIIGDLNQALTSLAGASGEVSENPAASITVSHDTFLSGGGFFPTFQGLKYASDGLSEIPGVTALNLNAAVNSLMDGLARLTHATNVEVPIIALFQALQNCEADPASLVGLLDIEVVALGNSKMISDQQQRDLQKIIWEADLHLGHLETQMAVDSIHQFSRKITQLQDQKVLSSGLANVLLGVANPIEASEAGVEDFVNAIGMAKLRVDRMGADGHLKQNIREEMKKELNSAALWKQSGYSANVPVELNAALTLIAASETHDNAGDIQEVEKLIRAALSLN